MATSSNTVLNNSDKNGHLCLVSNVSKNINYKASHRFLIDAHYQVEIISFYFSFADNFYQE